LAALGPEIASLSPDSEPALILTAHHDLLASFGKSFGCGFLVQPLLEPPSRERIAVFGCFNPQARQREFGLWITCEDPEGGERRPVAELIEFFLPERCSGRGGGTALIDALLELWAQIGVREVKATASGDGSCAFAAWGFQLAREDSQTPPRLVREELRQRAGLDGAATSRSVPEELREELEQLLRGQESGAPLLDMQAIYRLRACGGERFGSRLLHGVLWPARLNLPKADEVNGTIKAPAGAAAPPVPR
jgi:GNAT superfamily N-acetyltransferase